MLPSSFDRTDRPLILDGLVLGADIQLDSTVLQPRSDWKPLQAGTSCTHRKTEDIFDRADSSEVPDFSLHHKQCTVHAHLKRWVRKGQSCSAVTTYLEVV